VDVIQESDNILTGKYYDYFKDVFQKHQDRAKKYYEQEEEELNKETKPEGGSEGEGEEGAGAEAKPTEEKMSRSQRKKMRWLKVADLKARAKRPDLVEAWDITAPDPLFLCELKTLKNTIPVPRHWNQKSKFLQTKRGILKPMFKLPEFIEATGISKLRDPFSERDGSKMVREKLK
jgi:splicing factor 3B subunit 2